ncbi:MAG: hypothetical protein ACTSRS_11500 [Candidatus Helarchaeota archaeon]
MNVYKGFITIGIIMEGIEAAVGLFLYTVERKVEFLQLVIGYGIIIGTMFGIIIKTNYEPFQDFSCWALFLSLGLVLLGFGYFPWNLASPYKVLGLYTSLVAFSWAGYLTSWNIYAVRRKLLSEESLEEVSEELQGEGER